MIYIENIFVCLAIPMILAMIFSGKDFRRFILFVVTGMLICMLSAYINSFFMGYFNADEITTAIEITPVCEEVMKLLPLLFYFAVVESDAERVTPAAIELAVGFATFENVCYLAANGTEDFTFLLMRGFSAGALHILCGIVIGFGLVYIFKRSWLVLTGTFGLLGACITLHAIYNLMITADGLWRAAGYVLPGVLLVIMAVFRYVYTKKQNTERRLSMQ